MEKINIDQNIKVFGVQVKTFPNGIGDAFDGLIKMLPPKDSRSYYGIIECTKDGFVYIAAALETYDGEAEKYGCERYIVEKGDYLTIRVLDWTSKTDSIRYVFQEIFKDELSDKTMPCIEIYKNQKEMVCMVKVNQRKEIEKEYETVTKEFIELLSSYNDKRLNISPDGGSWTAGQTAKHVVIVNSGFIEMLNGSVKETERDKYNLVATIKRDFSDFTIKMRASESVTPKNNKYKKEDLLLALQDIQKSIKKVILHYDLSQTCLAFEIPVYGYLTRFEAIYFVICHTKRHIHQLKNIYLAVMESEVEKAF